MSAQDLAALLRGYRNRHNLTQSELAALLHVSVRTVEGWEIGRESRIGGLVSLLLRLTPRRLRALAE